MFECDLCDVPEKGKSEKKLCTVPHLKDTAQVTFVHFRSSKHTKLSKHKTQRGGRRKKKNSIRKINFGILHGMY